MVLSNVKYDRIRPFMVASIATIIALVAATMASSGWASAQGTGGTDPTPEPTVETPPDVSPGQLVRRGLSGKVLRVGGSSFLVETRHGKVLVMVNDQTTIKQPPNGEVRLSAVEIGDKVGVLLAKPENDTATSTEADIYRTATALKVVIVPSRATREHRRAIVLEKIKDAIKDRVKFLDRDGNEVEIETEIEIEGEEGEEVFLITRKGKHGQDERISSSARAEEIEERLRKLAKLRKDLEAKLEEVREKVNTSRGKLLDAAKAKFADRDFSDEIKARIDEARLKAQSRVDEARIVAQVRVDEARIKAQERVDGARADAAGRVDEARTSAQDRADAARANVRDRVENAVGNSDRLTDEQRKKLQERLDAASSDADERIKKAREDSQKRIQKAREDAETRIKKAREDSDVRISDAREDAEKRIEKAREQAQKRLEEARKAAQERRDGRDDDAAGDEDNSAVVAGAVNG